MITLFLIDQVVQGLILLSNVALIWCLSSEKRHLRRIAYIIGLVNVPLWLYSTLRHGQWGIFILSFWYAYCYWKGLQNIKGEQSNAT